MGEIRTRKRGKYWEYSFEGAKIDGKRHPISKSGFRTKAEALQAGTQAKAEYDNTGRSFSPASMSVADYMDYWYENYVMKNLGYKTQVDYEVKIRLHIKPSLGMYRLSALEPDTIQRWIDDKKRSGYSKNMVSHLLSCLSGALNYAVIPCRYISNNPCHYVRLPKIPVNKARKEYTEYICCPEDYASIMERFPASSNFHLPLVTGYHLGTRIGETYGFDLLHDVDFENHTISVNHQLTKEYKTWFYRSPKYDSFRTLVMDSKYESLLKEEIHNRKKNKLRYGEYYTKTYLLPDNSILQARADCTLPYPEIMPISVKEDGKLLTPESFKYCSRVIHEELGLVNFHSHSLRHTHGTILAENGAQPKTVMERLGHKDISTTMNRYVFNTEKMQQDAVDIFVKATS